ncbi:MAG: hypothetical protein K0R78_2367 [Pelosinus sp.]|nr:hypothetical protein [Pelosinus sp.]
MHGEHKDEFITPPLCSLCPRKRLCVFVFQTSMLSRQISFLFSYNYGKHTCFTCPAIFIYLFILTYV